MKQLAFFVVLIAVFGIGGLIYRNSLQAPLHGTNATAVSCPADTHTCPDGSIIKRTGPSCDFAACVLPNVELPQISISFILPIGFSPSPNPGVNDSSLIATYEKTMMENPKDSIYVSRYLIPDGKDANAIMLAQTKYQSSGNAPKAMTEFTPVIINGKTFQSLTVERFEAQVQTVYYLPRENDVLRFDVSEHNVTNWSDSSLDVRSLPDHKALETMLSTLQSD